MSRAAQTPTERNTGRGLGELLALNSAAMSALENLLREQVDAFEPEVRDYARYCLESSGKRLRPLLVFLSGWDGGRKVNTDLVRAAAVIEMVHLATLVHDDIMDHAVVRRGKTTVSEKDGPSVAVLLGDALFSQGVVLSTRFDVNLVCRRVAEATRRVCSGEILQTLGGADGAPDRGRYERVIDLKTAELFSVSCELGSALGGAGPGLVQSMAAFGRHLGIAYQVYDDLADFAGDTESIGKTLGTDWDSGKLTLPVLELLDRMPGGSDPEILSALGSKDHDRLGRVTALMRENGVFSSVMKRIHGELEQARGELSGHESAESVSLLFDLCRALERQARSLGDHAPGISG